jgi:anti-sigma factor RsiW
MSCKRSQSIDLAAFVLDPDAPEWSGFRAHYPGCRECSREVAEWTELEALLREAAGASHPGAEDLLSYARSGVPDGGEAIERHIETCASCRDALAASRALDLSRLRSAPEPRIVRRAAGRTAPAPVLGPREIFSRRRFSSPRSRWAVPALAAAGVAALLVTAAGIAFYATQRGREANAVFPEEAASPPLAQPVAPPAHPEPSGIAEAPQIVAKEGGGAKSPRRREVRPELAA